MTEVQFICTIGKGPISRAIQLQTRFEGSHTIILNAQNKRIVEALAHVPGEPWYVPGRVVERSLADYDLDTKCFWYKTRNEGFHHDMAWDFACRQVGMGYDFKGVARFVTRKSHALEDVVNWFCSEVATVTSRTGGDRVCYLPAWDVSPKQHATSTDFTLPKRMRIGEVLDA